MLYAILNCTDDQCEASFEAWCEGAELDGLVCDVCGCALQPVAFANADRERPPGGPVELQLRDAA